MVKKIKETAAEAVRREERLEAAVYQIMILKQEIKDRYEQQAALYQSLITDGVKVGDEFHSPSGTVVTYTDNFAEKDVVYRPAGVRRFELVESKKPKEEVS